MAKPAFFNVLQRKNTTAFKLVLAGAAAALAAGVSAPAAAGGKHGYYGHGYYGHGYHGRYYGRGYGHGRHYRRHHRGGGGKGAAIALGVIGGAIILNEIAESNAERRAYEDRFDRRYDRYSTRAAPPYDRDAFERGYERGLEAGRAEAPPQDFRDDGAIEDDLDAQLDGAIYNDRNDGGPAPIRFSAAGAYETCLTHARAALRERGYLLAGPATPETAVDTGAAWKMTATVSAENQTGDSWSRAMYCEADANRVYLLELI